MRQQLLETAGPSPSVNPGGDVRAFLRLGRPQFLVGGVAFVGLGAALAVKAGAALDPLTVALAQLGVTATQWAVHYANEVHDEGADRDNPNRTWLSGGTGLLASRQVPVAWAQTASRALYTVALAAFLVLASRVPATLAVTAPLLILAWAYSAPPLRLTARGVGELTTGTVVGLLVPGTVLLGAGLTPLHDPAVWFPLLPLTLQVGALVVVLSLPDEASDRAAGKRTLAVRWPGRPTRVLVQAVWLSCGLLTTAAVARGAPLEAILAGGIALAAAIGLPVLVLRRWWLAAGVYALAVVAAQWAVTLRWALS